MLLYTDIISGDEMFSDAFPMKLVDNIVYEVDCAMITIKEGDVNTGGNPSAEEAQEALEDGPVTVNNIVHSFRLQPTSFNAKSYGIHLRGYMKRLKTTLEKNEVAPAEIKEFETGASQYAKNLLKRIDKYDFYTGEKMDVDGMVALLDYREDGKGGETPYIIFWKHGLKEVKC